jgi:hypothetical protein
MHSILPTDRKAAIALATVKGEALVRWPGGRPRIKSGAGSGPTLRAPAVQILAGTEEWSVF